MLPSGVIAAVARGDVTPDPLFPEEAALVVSAVEVRRLEFARGRSCARRALSHLDIAPQPILADDKRAPIWPREAIGSISHCPAYCCAVVGRADAWTAIGVDVELLRPIEQSVQDMILVEAERAQLAHLDPSLAWPCVVFSIKEAIYKVWYPLTRRWLGHDDAVVTLDPARGRFEAEVRLPAHAPSWLRRLEGRFCVDGPYVIAAISAARPA